MALDVIMESQEGSEKAVIHRVLAEQVSFTVRHD